MSSHGGANMDRAVMPFRSHLLSVMACVTASWLNVLFYSIILPATISRVDLIIETHMTRASKYCTDSLVHPLSDFHIVAGISECVRILGCIGH